MWPWRKPQAKIRPFYLHRIVDASGVSGTGIVAVGVVLPSGKAVLEWCSRWKTVTVFESIGQVERIHGHAGRTLLHWGLPPKENSAASAWTLIQQRLQRPRRPRGYARLLQALPAVQAERRAP
ncbi:MAG: hypothetical protein M0Z66_08275 [Thermaerobacter sp.]|nr:hypothetical protein [Thermaerobacter sp.]